MSRALCTYLMLLSPPCTFTAEFDALIEDYGLYQLDTMGDAYIVVSGLVERDADGFHALLKDRSSEEGALDAWRCLLFAKVGARLEG